MKHAAIERWGKQDDGEIETRKREAIEKCQRRIDAARHLYQDGEMTREEYINIRDSNQQDILRWQNYTIDTEKIVAQLVLSLQTLRNIILHWEGANDEEKNGVARSLFDYIVIDLNMRQITKFRLKMWAEGYLTLKDDGG